MCLRLPDERIVATENFFCGSESENEIFIYGGQYCIQGRVCQYGKEGIYNRLYENGLT